MSGADFMFSKIEAKVGTKAKKLVRAPEPLEIDDAVRFLEEGGRDAKKLVDGLNSAIGALEAIRSSGLTGEALVVLVTEKCGRAANGSRLTAATVQVVLEGLFRLGEYTR